MSTVNKTRMCISLEPLSLCDAAKIDEVCASECNANSRVVGPGVIVLLAIPEVLYFTAEVSFFFFLSPQDLQDGSTDREPF